MSKDVLLLNADYFPLQAISWQRAMTLYFQEKVDVVVMSGLKIHSATQAWEVPSIIVLKKYKNGHARVSMSRDNLYIRDGYTCAYCGLMLKGRVKDLTLDHIVPKSRGGRSTWENLVTSCGPCNTKKADRTPEEASMPLLKDAFKPSRKELVLYSVSKRQFPHEWLDFFK